MLPDDYSESTVKIPPQLTPFKPGQSGNPAGRPKGSRNRQTIVKEALEAILEGSKQTVVDAITAAAIAKAMTGDIPAFNALMDSGYGKLTDKQEISGPDGAAIAIMAPNEAYKALKE